MDSYKMKFFWIDDTYDDKGYNKATYESLSKSEFLDLKPFKKLGPAIEEIKKLDFEIIFVLIKASLYQEYYFKLKELKSNLNCIPVSIIFASTKSDLGKVLEKKELDKKGTLKKEMLDSVGDEYYNKGGVAYFKKDI